MLTGAVHFTFRRIEKHLDSMVTPRVWTLFEHSKRGGAQAYSQVKRFDVLQRGVYQTASCLTCVSTSVIALNPLRFSRFALESIEQQEDKINQETSAALACFSSLDTLRTNLVQESPGRSMMCPRSFNATRSCASADLL